MRSGCKLGWCGVLLSAIGGLVRFAAAQELPVALEVQSGHTRSIVSVALSHDGRVALTGSEDHTAILWDTATGLTLRRLLGPGDHVQVVCLSGDAKIALTGSSDGAAILWDATAGKELRRFAVGKVGPVAIALSLDGSRVFSQAVDTPGILWDASTGRQVRTFGEAVPVSNDPQFYFSAAAFSRDNRLILAARQAEALLWDTTTGEKLATITLTLHPASKQLPAIDQVAISGDGRRAAVACESEIVLWDLERNIKLHSLTEGFDQVRGVALTQGGQRLWTGVTDDGTQIRTRAADNRVFEWDIATGRKLRELSGVRGRVTATALSSDASRVIVGTTSAESVLWETGKGERLPILDRSDGWDTAVKFSADSKRILTQLGPGAIAIWNAASGQQTALLQGHTDTVIAVDLSADGRRAATGARDSTVRLWDAESGKLLKTLTHADWVRSVGLAPDGGQVLAGTHDSVTTLWDAARGEKLSTLKEHEWPVTAARYCRDGSRFVTGSFQKMAIVWDSRTRQKVHAFPTTPFMVEGAIALSGDGKKLAAAMDDKTIALWDATTGQKLQTFAGHPEWCHAIAANADGSRVLTGSDDKTAVLWDGVTGKKLQTFSGHSHWVHSVALSDDGKRVLTGSHDATIRLWDAATGRELCQLYSFADGSWAVVDAEGRYDAAGGGEVKGLHWVAGFEPIALRQLKQRYYEPGLLAKAMGFNVEPLRPVSTLKTVKMYPAARLEPIADDSGKFRLELTDRGGGIGRVQVLVNGKELLADARGERLDPAAKSALLPIDLAGAALVPGQANRIAVVVWNSEGYLASRGLEEIVVDKRRAEDHPPELYAIVGGVSEYAAPALKLRFAAKDAADAAKALNLAAGRLFGAERVHLTLLSSDQPAAGRPTKENFRAAFTAAQKARPGDVLVVYLAGHGISLSRGEDLYCYLTEEARAASGEAFADPAVLASSAITSDELVEWIKRIPARKQVMLLDTCAAGAAAARLIEHRDLGADQIRAIDRLKDRTGFHVLMGCAADRVSYEASQYSQGLLTYALLQGMRGAALREDEYVDVSLLFQFAADEVPQLARNIGGIQRPLVMAPSGTSFDVGRLLSADKAAIPLALVRPLVLRPLLVNPDVGDDDLNLLPLLRKQISAESYSGPRGGTPPPLVYVDADELPGAIRPAGTYTVDGDKVSVRLNLRREGKTAATVTIDGTKQDLPGLVTRLVQELIAAVAKL